MIAVGVDTHKERHHAVALDDLGQMLAELVFTASAAGYRELQDWAEALAADRRARVRDRGRRQLGRRPVRAPATRRTPGARGRATAPTRPARRQVRPHRRDRRRQARPHRRERLHAPAAAGFSPPSARC